MYKSERTEAGASTEGGIGGTAEGDTDVDAGGRIRGGDAESLERWDNCRIRSGEAMHK